MIDDPRGAIDYAEQGSGPATLVFVPGSFATGAAWLPVIGALAGRYRIVTTSLLGYGGTAERRHPHSLSIDREVEVLDAVLQRAGGPVHLVDHSFGAVVALAWAMRSTAQPLSLTLIEPPLPGVLDTAGEHALLAQFRAMSDPYMAAWLVTVPGASHFMIATHADDVARLAEAHIAAAARSTAA
jgi:pimeloyl-ACP methyl ester carboxylesterase